MSLSLIFWMTCSVALISFWWQSDKVKIQAMNLILHYCKQQQLQLLDQTMVLKGVWPQRDDSGSLRLRRRYAFEFTSTGEARYTGKVELIGRKLQSIDLEAHILPHEPDQLH